MEAAINSIRFELQVLQWDDAQCLRLTNVLNELSALMRCPQFAIEFVKAQGLEFVFQLVERFQHTDQVKPGVLKQQVSVWSSLVACLAQISEYGISSADEEFSDISREEESREVSGGPDTALNRTFNELFSWHLVSDTFVAVLSQKCMVEYDMTSLKNELKVLLKLLNHCVHNVFGPEGDQANRAASNPPGPATGEDSAMRCSGTATPLELSGVPEWAIHPLRNELMCYLLGCMYVLLYHAFRAGRLATVLPNYLNSRTLSELRSYLPQMKLRPRQLLQLINALDSSKRPNAPKFPSEIGVSPIATRRESSSRGGSNFFFHVATTVNPEYAKPTTASLDFMAPVHILYRLQRLQFALLANELMMSAHQEVNYQWSTIPVIAPDVGYSFSHFGGKHPRREGKQHAELTDARPDSERLARKLSEKKITFDGIPRYYNADEISRLLGGSSTDRQSKRVNPPSNSSAKTSLSRPQFPLIQVVSSICHLLCQLFNVTDRIETLRFPEIHKIQPDLNLFYPMFFEPRASGITAFEDIFIISICVFFDVWTQLNACSPDVDGVVLWEQLSYTIKQDPLSLEEFEQLLRQYNLQSVLTEWKRTDQVNREEMYKTHPILKDLNAHLRKSHRGHVQDQRINAMMCSAPLEYVPQKNQKQPHRDSVKYQVYLSPDLNSLVLMDQKKCTQGLWPLTCIERVTTGTEERVKKNPERTIVLRISIRDSNEQDECGLTASGKSHVALLARNEVDYNYWLDGFYFLRLLNSPSKRFAEDIQLLTVLDMELRVAGLDLSVLPTKPRPIPPDPPEFDFKEP
ncbi:unnamed protein product [Echinostoma caproni]|uniref:ELMO domain-containing protein n=1 Tax=Echinostoma caproni TaxID=27848 RepID=A0A183ABM4_9TREM|nr:unnamed protein product [Echinostoma caproni]